MCSAGGREEIMFYWVWEGCFLQNSLDLSVISGFPLLSQDCTKGKFGFKGKEVLLLRCDAVFCNSAMRICQTPIPLKKASSFLILAPAILLSIFLLFLCCPGLVFMDSVKYGVNIWRGFTASQSCGGGAGYQCFNSWSSFEGERTVHPFLLFYQRELLEKSVPSYHLVFFLCTTFFPGQKHK